MPIQTHITKQFSSTKCQFPKYFWQSFFEIIEFPKKQNRFSEFRSIYALKLQKKKNNNKKVWANNSVP